MGTTVRRALVAAAVVLVCAGPFTPALADAERAADITVVVGQTVTFPLPRQPQILASEDPLVASVDVLPEGRIRVQGKKVGRTRIVGRDNAQVPMIFTVEVTAPPPPQPPTPSE